MYSTIRFVFIDFYSCIAARRLYYLHTRHFVRANDNVFRYVHVYIYIWISVYVRVPCYELKSIDKIYM